MKDIIKKELKKNNIINHISDIILLYANIKHPNTIIFNKSKFKKLYTEHEIFPSHLLTPVPSKNKINFELILHDSKQNKKTTIFL